VSIYFDYTPFHQSVYERVHSDEKDVAEAWNTLEATWLSPRLVGQNRE